MDEFRVGEPMGLNMGARKRSFDLEQGASANLSYGGGIGAALVERVVRPRREEVWVRPLEAAALHGAHPPQQEAAAMRGQSGDVEMLVDAFEVLMKPRAKVTGKESDDLACMACHFAKVLPIPPIPYLC